MATETLFICFQCSGIFTLSQFRNRTTTSRACLHCGKGTIGRSLPHVYLGKGETEDNRLLSRYDFEEIRIPYTEVHF